MHRVGRTARAEAEGDAFLLVSPEEEASLRDIERVINKRLPRVTVPGFDYSKRPVEKLEVPLGQRLAAHRERQGQKRKPAHASGGRRPGGAGRGPGPGGAGAGRRRRSERSRGARDHRGAGRSS